MTRTLTTCTFVLSVASLALFSLAGPLNPPAGAVSSTAKPLAEIEPRIAVNATNTPGDGASTFRITQPGSYYLAANLIGEGGKNGIKINASNVTLDLNGFTVNGQGNIATFNGVYLEGAISACTVRNGTVVGWGANGVYHSGGSAQGHRIERIISRDNGGTGIAPADSASVIECTTIGNGNDGISVSSSATVVSCVSRGNADDGIVVGTGCTVSHSTARSNGGTGFNVGPGSVAKSCTSSENNTGFIIGGIAEGCFANQSADDGFVLLSAAIAAGCVAKDNAANGFDASPGCTISDCRSSTNTLHGFTFSTGCTITGNGAYANGAGGTGAGFHTAGSDSRIERNHNRGGDYGFWVSGSGSRNLIIGNSTAGTTTAAWELIGGNIYGAIVDRSAAATLPVSGGTAASSMSTTDPHANITH